MNKILSLELEEGREPASIIPEEQDIAAKIKQAIVDKRAAKKAELAKPLADGEHENFDADGVIKEKFVIANGKRNGICELYSKGLLSLKATVIDDVKDGPAIAYNSKEEMTAKMFYRDNELNGVVETYQKGRVISMAMFKNGKANGITITYDAQGNVKVKEPKKDGETHGVVETYNHVGLLGKTCEFVMGVKDGFQKIFYPDGGLKKIEEYRSDLKEGVDREYYPNAVLKSEAEFLNGKIVRAQVDYSPKGKIL